MRRPAHRRSRGSGGRGSGAVLRLTPNDLTTLLSDRGPAPMNIAAVLVIDSGARLGRAAVLASLESGAARVPRLTQRLRSAPFGCGRPYWLDDETFSVERHLTVGRVDTEEALWLRVAELVCRPLPRDRPLWAAHWLDGLPDGSAALAIVTHHVLTDGIGGLAVLAALCDPGGAAGASPSSRSTPAAPTRTDLATDAWRARLHALGFRHRRLRLVGSGLRDLGVRPERPRLCPRTSLNQPTGSRRHLAVMETSLTGAIASAHRHRATLNDLLLCAAAGALGRTLADRGERVDSVVLSVPYSSRSSTTTGRLGNETGVVPFRIPVGLDPLTRLQHVAQLTRRQRGRPRAASAAPLGVVFRGLARVGLLQWFVDHQRLVNSFVSNLRGPDTALTFCGCAVTRLVPVAVTPGNVGVTFDVLSYAGTLTLGVVTDPDVVGDPAPLMAHLRDEVELLVR